MSTTTTTTSTQPSSTTRSNPRPPVHIRISTSRAAIPHATSTLFSAFESDPVTAYILHHLPPSSRRDALASLFHLTSHAALLAGGELWSSSTERGADFHAAAVIFPPHTSLDDLGASALPRLLLGGGLVKTLCRIGPGVFGRRLQAFAAATAPAKKDTFPDGGEGFYYVNLVGTEAAHRGKGLAPALIRSLQERAGKEGRKVYLEASNEGARAVYLKLGFRDTAEVIRMGVGEVGEDGEVNAGEAKGVPLWPMVWEGNGSE